jgi:hypothetical protein
MKKLRTKVVYVSAVFFLAVWIIPANVLAKADTTTTNIKQPLDETTFVPCADGGAGEDVHFTGTSHMVFHVTDDAGGKFHMTGHFNTQAVKGTGLTTGDTYQGIDSINGVQNNGMVGGTFTQVENFLLIGPGPGNNFMIQRQTHITVNANGEVTAEVDNLKENCK